MKKEIYYCDICKEKLDAERTIEKNIQVIFVTEQNESKLTMPYLELVDLDWCEQCRYKALQGQAIFAEGAMGHNRYFFKDNRKLIESEIWQSHTLSDDFIKRFNVTDEQKDAINALCLKSHNEVLEKLLKNYWRLYE